MTPSWSWPASHAIVLYHWSWFDQAAHDVITGWSQQAAVDEAGYVHFEEEALADRRSIHVVPTGMPVVKAHTFAGLQALPLELRDDAGQPLAWVQELLQR